MDFLWITIFSATLGAISVFADHQPFILDDSPGSFNLQPGSQKIAGGLSHEQEMIPELQEKIIGFSPQIKEDITDLVLQNNPDRIPQQYLKNFRFAMSFLRLHPLSFRSQVVAGTNYFVLTGFGFQCFVVELFEGLPTSESINEISYRRTVGPVSCSSN